MMADGGWGMAEASAVLQCITMGTLNLRIPDDLKRELEALCRQQQRPASEIVRDSLRRYIAAERFHALRGKTLPFAEAQGFLTDEDVFEAIS